jgi:hypothetical protein
MSILLDDKSELAIRFHHTKENKEPAEGEPRLGDVPKRVFTGTSCRLLLGDPGTPTKDKEMVSEAHAVLYYKDSFKPIEGRKQALRKALDTKEAREKFTRDTRQKIWDAFNAIELPKRFPRVAETVELQLAT